MYIGHCAGKNIKRQIYICICIFLVYVYINAHMCMDNVWREKLTVVAFGEGNWKPGNKDWDVDLHPTVSSVLLLKFFTICLYYL